MEQWNEIKRRERGDQSALTGVPNSLPALARAQALQQRAARAGFVPESIDQAWNALDRDLEELRHTETPKEQREGIGDALFTLVNLARSLDADAEDALRSKANVFTNNFRRMEKLAKERDIELNDASNEDKLALWEEAKRQVD
jgi:uncharacterized protein YabN with tetrapyrrole methylase and pyrophosphatase domain